MVTNEPVKKASQSAKVGSRSIGTRKITRTAPAKARSTITPKGDPRPLQGYAGILAGYAVVSGALTFGLRHKKSKLSPLRPMELLLFGLATEHLSRVITKDSLTSFLRAPFTEFKEAAGEGEVNEEVIGTGARHAVGELLTCPFCLAQWVATGLIAGSVALPGLTTAVVSVSAVARLSDYLDLVYGLLRQEQ
jgi:hypothetical protein